MSLKLSDSMMSTAHHVNDGPVEMYKVDARLAVANHPLEWSHEPWDPEKAAIARKRLHERKVAAAEAAGEHPPAAPVEPDMTDEDRAEFEEWKAARQKAKEIVDAAEKEKAEKAAKAAEIEQAEAVLKSPPPKPQPRRPGRPSKADLEAEQKRLAAARSKAAADKAAAEKAAADKAEGDRQAAAAQPGDGT
jgi:colicin import membrane protein